MLYKLLTALLTICYFFAEAHKKKDPPSLPALRSLGEVWVLRRDNHVESVSVDGKKGERDA